MKYKDKKYILYICFLDYILYVFYMYAFKKSYLENNFEGLCNYVT